jgi:hypothetical protein
MAVFQVESDDEQVDDSELWGTDADEPTIDATKNIGFRSGSMVRLALTQCTMTLVMSRTLTDREGN